VQLATVEVKPKRSGEVMKIIHHIALSSTAERRSAFMNAGIQLEAGFVSFQIAESDSRWPDVEALVREYDVIDSVFTEFSSDECKQAQYLELLPTWHHGYPMPDEENFGYLRGFDLTEYCSDCGIGLRQIAPFQMKGAPKWGRRSILQLNWVFDEYFVTPELWTTIFEPLDIGSIPVLSARNQTVIDSVVQLKVEQLVEIELADAPFEECRICRRRKYLPITRGFAPKPITTTDSVMMKSQAYFGSGANAFRMVFVSNLLYENLSKARIRGITYSSCAS
jgi:hypothetical protein